jgi:hypothetical protein
MQKCCGLSHVGALAILVSILGCATLAAPSNNQESAPLKQVADVPLPGPAVRFDYQSLDASHGRLYIAHMNADQLVVFVGEAVEICHNFALLRIGSSTARTGAEGSAPVGQIKKCDSPL